MKVSVKFANGNGMAFLGQGYITSGDKKVFVRLYTTSDLRRVVVKMYRHRRHLCDGSPSRTRIEFDF